MEIILFVIIYSAISLFFLNLLRKWEDFTNYDYDISYCRDVRATLEMFTYASDLEETREYLNSKKAKF